MSRIVDEHAPLSVYVPRDRSRPLLGIRAGSAIVGGRQAAPSGRIAVDYEGNLYGIRQFDRYANRVHHAAGRHASTYPTVARAWVEADDLVAIGEFSETSGEIALFGVAELELLCDWLGVAALDPEELSADAVRFQIRREIIAARGSADPARRFAAEQLRRRHQIEI